jgi:hypothetical protein
MCGSATFAMVLSSACMTEANITVMVMSTRCFAGGAGDDSGVAVGVAGGALAVAAGGALARTADVALAEGAGVALAEGTGVGLSRAAEGAHAGSVGVRTPPTRDSAGDGVSGTALGLALGITAPPRLRQRFARPLPPGSFRRLAIRRSRRRAA